MKSESVSKSICLTNGTCCHPKKQKKVKKKPKEKQVKKPKEKARKKRFIKYSKKMSECF